MDLTRISISEWKELLAGRTDIPGYADVSEKPTGCRDYDFHESAVWETGRDNGSLLPSLD